MSRAALHFLSVGRVSFFCIILFLSIVPLASPAVRATESSTNTIVNLSFEEGVDSQGYPVSWGNWTKHGSPNSSVTVDNSRSINGTYSAKLQKEKDDATCCFVALFQSLSNLRFRNLSNRSDGLDFWFYLEPKFDGIGDFRIRILFGENVAELNYVFPSPNTIWNYPNITDAQGIVRVRSIILEGFETGQWHRFQRNLRADWEAVGFNPSIEFARIQFDALSFTSSELFYSETVWIDDVKVYRDPAHWLTFIFQDQDGSTVYGYVEWSLLSSSGKSVEYTMGEVSLPLDIYFLEVYYPRAIGLAPEPFRIHRQSIGVLDDVHVIGLPMTLQFSNPVSYIALDGPAQTSSIQEDSTALRFTVSGGPFTIVVVKSSREPTAVIRDDDEIAWTYYPVDEVVRIPSIMPGRFSVIFTQPPRMPAIRLTDATGDSIEGVVALRLQSSGSVLAYSPNRIVLSSGPHVLQAYYEGHRILSVPLQLSTSASQELIIRLEMLPLTSAPGAYLAFNQTQSFVNIVEQNSRRLAFKSEGLGPLLIVAKVSKKPLYVEKDGQRIFWTYNTTTGTASLETEAPGSILLVFEDQPWFIGIPLTYLGAFASVAGAAAATTMWFLRQRKRRLTTA